MTITEFSTLRYGLFVHFGLYSMLGRGEWAMNREGFTRQDYRSLASEFNPVNFDADALCDLAVRAGMRYIVFTTMHHEGFRLYDSKLSDFNSMKACGRDLVAEVVGAARSRGLKIGLYHSLNNWIDEPDGCDALENTLQKERFIASTHARIGELVEKFQPIDVLWYDGWWPFDASGWNAETMNAELRRIQPDLLFNGRNGLAGDFATPEGHITAPTPYRPWEACLSLNESWGFNVGDHDWKSPWQVVEMLTRCANGSGNLLLNVGPRGDGSIPEAATSRLECVGQWLKAYGAAIFGTDYFIFDPQRRLADHRGDWCHFGPLTASGHDLFLLARRWPETEKTSSELTLRGLETRVASVELMEVGEVEFSQREDCLSLHHLPALPVDSLCSVLRIRCESPPSLYSCGGMRVPSHPHPRYDPLPSDIAW